MLESALIGLLSAVMSALYVRLNQLDERLRRIELILARLPVKRRDDRVGDESD